MIDIKLINKYIERVKIDYPEDDKLMIDLQQFAQEVVKNCSIPAVVGRSEQFKCDCGCTNHYKNEMYDSVKCADCGTVYARI